MQSTVHLTRVAAKWGHFGRPVRLAVAGDMEMSLIACPLAVGYLAPLVFVSDVAPVTPDLVRSGGGG